MSLTMIAGGRVRVDVGFRFNGGGHPTVSISACAPACELSADDAEALAAVLRAAAREARRLDREKRRNLRRGARGA